MAPWSVPRKLAWGSREVKGWSPGKVAESWAPIPARGRRWDVAALENREKIRSLLPPIAQSRPQPRAPGGRRHSLPCPGTGPGKENLPLLRLPEKGRKTGARSQHDSAWWKVRRSSEGEERPGAGAGNVLPLCPERQQLDGSKDKAETVQSEDMSEDCESVISADDEEFTNERIIDWLIGVNACLYRDTGLGHWNTQSSSEQDTSIKIVHEGD